VLVEPRHEPFAAAPDDARGFEAAFVIVKTLFGGESGHADVIAGFAIALRVA
jgi:hypothetical protein